jgi:flagellar basal-body rod protein FlgF
MDVTAHNLANASTTGFKRDGLAFSEAFEREMFMNGRGIGSMGAGPVLRDQYTVFEQGAVHHTGVDLDVAIDGDGAFAVQTPDRGILYTRDGSFKVDAQNRLVTRQGHPVLDTDLRPIELAPGTVQIDPAGGVSVDGADRRQLGVFQARFAKAGGNLFFAQGATPVAEPSVTPRALEGSNVNPMQAMVDMVKIGRLYEIAQKSIQSQDDLTQRLIQSLQDR